MIFSTLIIELRLPICHSLKEKRSYIRPLLNRLHKEFNVTASEIDKNDIWGESIIACGLITNEKRASEAHLAQIVHFIERFQKDIMIERYSIQFF